MRAILVLPALALGLSLAACNPDPVIDPRDPAADADGDGFDTTVDCNDADGLINPEADELCDEIDNDCDGLIDEYGAVDAPIWYVDGDEDGFGDPDVTREACEAPDSYVDNADDCDDAQDSVYPEADEICDGLDNDCDDEIDEPDALDAETYFWDFDGDGFGNPDRPERSCTSEEWLVENNTDCNDADPGISPAGQEVCDGVDNDCDGLTDDEDTSTDPESYSVFYPDADGDGYGVPSEEDLLLACSVSEGYADNADDCNDADDTLTTDCSGGGE